jgi:hypothetical protein
MSGMARAVFQNYDSSVVSYIWFGSQKSSSVCSVLEHLRDSTEISATMALQSNLSILKFKCTQFLHRAHLSFNYVPNYSFEK